MNAAKQKKLLIELREKYKLKLSQIDGDAYYDLNSWKKKILYADRLKAIVHALQTMERGAYGVCNICGEPITECRLESVPFTVRCYECELAKQNII